MSAAENEVTFTSAEEECWQCSGVGMLPGCFEDTCCGADCDPDDAETCCSPRRCDICNGRGHFKQSVPL